MIEALLPLEKVESCGFKKTIKSCPLDSMVKCVSYDGDMDSEVKSYDDTVKHFSELSISVIERQQYNIEMCYYKSYETDLEADTDLKIFGEPLEIGYVSTQIDHSEDSNEGELEWLEVQTFVQYPYHIDTTVLQDELGNEIKVMDLKTDPSYETSCSPADPDEGTACVQILSVKDIGQEYFPACGTSDPWSYQIFLTFNCWDNTNVVCNTQNPPIEGNSLITFEIDPAVCNVMLTEEETFVVDTELRVYKDITMAPESEYSQFAYEDRMYFYLTYDAPNNTEFELVDVVLTRDCDLEAVEPMYNNMEDPCDESDVVSYMWNFGGSPGNQQLGGQGLIETGYPPPSGIVMPNHASRDNVVMWKDYDEHNPNVPNDKYVVF